MPNCCSQSARRSVPADRSDHLRRPAGWGSRGHAGRGVGREGALARVFGRPAQHVPAWMIQIAWEYLTSHGRVSTRHLLADDGLNVNRSSFVCALLATLPGVTVASRRRIELKLIR